MPVETVGMIGLGIMGSAMSANLVKGGFSVVGYDVLPACGRQLRQAGGTVVRSAREVGTRSSIIVTSLPSSEALLETAAALSRSARSKQIVIETSTLPIALKEEARRELDARGITLLDCPVSGSGAQARVKDIVVYVSGNHGAYRRARPIMEGFARAHYYIGPFGAGSKMKFVANLLVGIHSLAAAEALTLGIKAGLDPAMIVKVVADGGGGSRMLQMRGPLMVHEAYAEATMKLKLWQKDMTIINEFARQLDCPTPLFAASAPIYTAALATRDGSEDMAAVCAVLEAMANSPRIRRPRQQKERSTGTIPPP